ncbi:interferon-induced very large GTPase 1-like [Rhinophrynus dorsalis]
MSEEHPAVGGIKQPPEQTAGESTLGHVEESVAEHAEKYPSGHIKECPSGHDKECPAGHVEESTAGHVEESSAGYIEESLSGHVEKSIAGLDKKLPTGYFEEFPAGHVEELPAGHVEEFPAGHVEELPAGHVEEFPAEHVEELPAGHVEEFPAGHVEEFPAGHVEELPAGHVEDFPAGHVEELPAGHVEEFPAGHVEELPAGHVEEFPAGHVEEFPAGHVEEFPAGHVEEFPAGHVEELPAGHVEEFPARYIKETKDLHHLISGNDESTDKLNTKNNAKEIQSVCQISNQEYALDVASFQSNDQQLDTEHSNDVITNQEFSNLIKDLGLEKYFPRKLKRRNNCISKSYALNKPECESELPVCFLQMLITLDYQFRYLVSKDLSEAKSSEDMLNTLGEVNKTFSNIDDFFNNISKGEKTDTAVINKSMHPMDLQMAIYHCADDFMRQYIFTKLSICQFALPFIVPTADGSGLELPLWSFRQIEKNIIYTAIDGTVKHKEKLVCKAEIPVVSFTRFGASDFSKSQLLNNLLNKHKHNIFFHRNCKGSTKKCILMEGLVEIFWFCPGGMDDKQFEQCTAFVNLHGDVRTHRRQASFLQEISTINVVIFSESDKDETGTKIFMDMLNSEKPLICLCPDRDTSNCAGNNNNNNNKVIIGLQNQNEAELMDTLMLTLRHLLKLAPQSLTLEACGEIARQHGFLVDEDRNECKEGKAFAETMMCLLKDNDLPKAKKEILPLSGHLWSLWCKKDKELTRLQNKKNRSIEKHRSEIESEKKLIRHEQLRMATENLFTISFIRILKTLSKTTTLFFLQWFKIFLDDLSCDRILELRDQYNRIWSHLQTEQSGDKSIENALQKNMEAVKNEMTNCMIGLEHLLREVGQMYEAVVAVQQRDEYSNELPKIAAEIMTSGYPIELMDGDASYVPLRWIGAVLEELIKIIGDKKLFVLSVLGVQSSGKSTLLNTMFGLQFAVSAGRCTRGAFMQLIELEEELKNDLNFDYILVIDTEGLRAMELANHLTLNHDNELATFVIGVANMTLINVFGENPSEVKDFLQIAVQAFLRMKQVKLSPSCLFVHQNVGEITALEKNMEARRNLQIELDKMACLASEQEHCNVQRFSDVIRFDVNSHIYYFAHLWEGNPPMAPPNPMYSRNALEVRNLILQAGRKGAQRDILSISEFKVRIKDLWSALRNENFVFSFKNTLEISAYSKVENKYSKLTWQVRRHILKLQVKLNNQIKKGEISSVKLKDLEDQVKDKFDAIMGEFETFFNDDKDKHVLIQWKANTENRLKNLMHELTDETKRQCEEHIRIKESQNNIKEKETHYKDELFRRSKQMALDLKNKVLDEEELRDHFNKLWQEWVTEITLTVPCVEIPNIAADIDTILLEYFKKEPCIGDKLNDESKWKSFSIDFQNHVKLQKWAFNSMMPLQESDKENINQVKTDLVKKIEKGIEMKQKHTMDYNPVFFREIVNEIQNINSVLNQNFTLTVQFMIDLSLYLCHMAVPVFEEMHQAFQKANNPVITMESKQEEFFNCFKISCQGANSIKTFVNILCSKLLEAIRPAVYHRASLTIIDEITTNCPALNGNRSKLETYILLSLVKQEDYKKYRQYLHFPKRYFESFIEECVEKYFLDKDSERLKQCLNNSLDHFHHLVRSAINQSTLLVKDKCSSVSEWLDEFYKQIEDKVSFSRADLKSIEHQEILDIEFIKETMCTVWDTTMDNFKHKLDVESFDEFETKAHTILAKQLGGCWEQCPFCRAICTNTISGHDGDHSVHFHRPQALNGISWVASNTFVTEICTSLVMSDATVVIKNKKIQYKDYRKIGPDFAKWSITPDTSSQHHWKWFVCRFRTNLETSYDVKFAEEIPPEWEQIRKGDVIAELQELIPDENEQIMEDYEPDMLDELIPTPTEQDRQYYEFQHLYEEDVIHWDMPVKDLLAQIKKQLSYINDSLNQK